MSGQPFRPELDELIATIGSFYPDGLHRLDVSVRRYDDGPLKISIERWYCTIRRPEWLPVRTGRFTVAEAEGLGRLLLQAAFANEEPKPAPESTAGDDIPWGD